MFLLLYFMLYYCSVPTAIVAMRCVIVLINHCLSISIYLGNESALLLSYISRSTRPGREPKIGTISTNKDEHGSKFLAQSINLWKTSSIHTCTNKGKVIRKPRCVFKSVYSRRQSLQSCHRSWIRLFTVIAVKCHRGPAADYRGIMHNYTKSGNIRTINHSITFIYL